MLYFYFSHFNHITSFLTNSTGW